MGGNMFAFASNFNQPLNDWNVANVNDMKSMFRRAIDFNQPLDDWDVSSVTEMGFMFAEFILVANFNQCLSTWADKTPPDVDVGSIFFKSGCPDKDAVATV